MLCISFYCSPKTKLGNVIKPNANKIYLMLNKIIISFNMIRALCRMFTVLRYELFIHTTKLCCLLEFSQAQV